MPSLFRLTAYLGLSGSLYLFPCGSHANEYVITIMTPHGGSFANVGKSMRNGISLALEQAEDKGRFREGVHLSLKDFDDNEPATKLVQESRKQVIESDAILILGPMMSTHAEAMAIAANRFEFPMLSPAVSDGITAAGPWSFRSGVSPHLLIQAIVRNVVTSTKAKKVAIVHMSGNSGFESQARTVAASVEKLGRFTVADIELNDSEDGYAQASSSLLSVKPDLIFMMIDAEPGGVLAARLRKDGLPADSRLIFGPAAASPALLQVGREFVNGAIVATDYLPEMPGEVNRDFVTAYHQRYGLPPDRWAGLGYTTGLIAAEAIRTAGPAPTRALVRDALERVGKISTPIGQQTWSMGNQRDPLYEPILFTIQSGQFVPYKLN